MRVDHKVYYYFELVIIVTINMGIHKDIFACLFSIHNTISLSCREQVCLSGLCFERGPMMGEVSLET